MIRPMELVERLAQQEAHAQTLRIIKSVRAEIEPGVEIANELLSVVVSERGCYYRMKQTPDEFSALLGNDYAYSFLDTVDALAIMRQCQALTRQCRLDNAREVSLYARYERYVCHEQDHLYLYLYNRDCQESSIPMEVGRWRAGQLPVFLKLKIASPLARPLLGAEEGILVFAANMSDRHLCLRMPYHTEKQAAGNQSIH